MLKLKPNTLTSWCRELTHLKRPWCWERLRAGGEGDDRGWDGWMASLTQWTWVWLGSGSWWWTGRPDVLRFMGLQRVEHNWMTKLNWIPSSLAAESTPWVVKLPFLFPSKNFTDAKAFDFLWLILKSLYNTYSMVSDSYNLFWTVQNYINFIWHL